MALWHGRYGTTLWTTILIADLCEWDGKRHIRYRDLAEVSQAFA